MVWQCTVLPDSTAWEGNALFYLIAQHGMAMPMIAMAGMKVLPSLSTNRKHTVISLSLAG
jgi:hypothetical protein